MSLLEIRDLQAEYRRPDGTQFTVLKIPEFKLESGSQTGMKGKSGSGKTTFLNVISGILLPVQGKVEVDGTDVTKLSETQRDQFRGSHIGFIFQTFHLLSGFTAVENVVLGSVFAGDPNEETATTKQRACHLLEKVGLADRMHHRPSMLSSGEQQRVAIARSLMNKPKLILADEPTGSLDEKSGNEVLELIRSLASSSGASLLLVTHDPSVMAQFSHVVDLSALNKPS
jgi:ABC-type lipoprotein export system ATPase subunit